MKERGEKSCINRQIIKDRRKAKNFTQYKLAEEAGLNHNHIGQIERGQKEPKVRTLYRICEALDLEMDAVLIKEEKKELEIEECE